MGLEPEGTGRWGGHSPAMRHCSVDGVSGFCHLQLEHKDSVSAVVVQCAVCGETVCDGSGVWTVWVSCSSGAERPRCKAGTCLMGVKQKGNELQAAACLRSAESQMFGYCPVPLKCRKTLIIEA